MIRTILIVDADTSRARELTAILRRAGCVVSTASTFRDGVRLLHTARPGVLVTALKLGAYNGLHLLLRGRAEDPHLCAIVVGPRDLVVEGDARELGAAAYLPAPATATAIFSEIQKLTVAEDGDGSALESQGAFEASVS